MGATYRYTEIDMKRHFIVCACAVGLMSTLPACAGSLTYSAEPIHAQVIDADTQQPIKGVVVTANWQLEQGTAGGNIQAGQLMVMEAVTDNEGKFSFPAWGPKTARESFLVNDDPQLLLFKSGYEYRRLNNPYSSDRELRLRPVRKSEWNGRTIVLKPFKGTMREYVKHLSFLMTGLRFIEDDCQWKKTTRMLMALQKQADAFKASDTVTAIYSVDYMPTDEKKCGSVKEYFRRYQQ